MSSKQSDKKAAVGDKQEKGLVKIRYFQKPNKLGIALPNYFGKNKYYVAIPEDLSEAMIKDIKRARDNQNKTCNLQ